MSGVSVLQHFEVYQKARVSFVQAVAEAATRPQNIEVMQNAGVMQLLRPLLLDNVPSIQQSAALALGRLANYSEDLAEAVVGNEILPQLVYSLSEQNRFVKKAAAFVLRAVAKHSPDLAQAVVDSGALDALVPCLEEFDPTVKEAAAWAIGYIAQHNSGACSRPPPARQPRAPFERRLRRRIAKRRGGGRGRGERTDKSDGREKSARGCPAATSARAALSPRASPLPLFPPRAPTLADAQSSRRRSSTRARSRCSCCASRSPRSR